VDVLVLALLTGFAFGFVASMPIAGPISFLVLARGLHGRYRSGLLIALGAALPEGVYAFLAFWGMSTVMALHPLVSAGTAVAGALILVLLGIHLVRLANSSLLDENGEDSGHKRSFLLGFTVTALNPTLLATWPAAVAALHSTGLVQVSRPNALPYALGISAGIVCWFAMLLALLRRHQTLFGTGRLTRIVHALGLLIIGVGLWMAVAAGRQLLSRL
jgi:threonine/homoserine/homoserine lactone efflux protein